MVALLLSSAAARAQGVLLQEDVPPSDGFGHRTLSTWDFDGPGPLPPELLLGTDGGRVMAYNGTRWRQVGPRLSGLSWSASTDPVAFKFLNFRGELHVVAAGSISSTPGGLFRWTGSTWALIPACNAPGVAIWMVSGTVWNDQIVVVGQGLRCGASTALALAWNGSSWSRVGDLFTTNHPGAIVGAVHATSDGRLLIGGTIPVTGAPTLIAELVDGVWVTRATGFASNIPISGFQELDGELFALCSRVSIPGQDTFPIAVLRENQNTGVWERWFPATPTPLLATEVTRILRDGDRTLLAASFDTSEGMVLARTADGPWVKATLEGSIPTRMRDVAAFEGQILAVGVGGAGRCPRSGTAFEETSANPPVFRVLPSRFAPPTSGTQQVNAFAATSEGWFAHLGFGQSGGLLAVASGPVSPSNPCPIVTSAPSVFLDGDWRIPEAIPAVRDIIEYNDDTYALGSFTSSNLGPLTAGIARWTGVGWESAFAPLSTAAVSGAVHQGSLHVSESTGNLTTVRRWDGMAWVSVGGSMTGGASRLLAVGPDLYAYVPGTTVCHRLDGNAWTQLPFAPGSINDASDADGTFTIAIAGVLPQPVIRFVGGAWEPLPAFPVEVQVRALVWHEGALFAGLAWTSNTMSSPLMRLSSGTWTPAVSVTPPRQFLNHPAVSVHDLASDGDTLHLAGTFSFIGGQTAESWIRFYTGLPRVLTPPTDVRVSRCDSSYFSVEPEVYHDPAQTYQWLRDGQPLADGPTPAGSSIVGAATLYLRIDNTRPTDAGSYSLVLTNAKGMTTTSAGVLSVCAAEFNCDTVLNADDLGDFINCLFASPPCPDADFNIDGEINADDLGDYLNVFFAGC